MSDIVDKLTLWNRITLWGEDSETAPICNGQLRDMIADGLTAAHEITRLRAAFNAAYKRGQKDMKKRAADVIGREAIDSPLDEYAAKIGDRDDRMQRTIRSLKIKEMPHE
jgi:hypothetical protein